MKSKTPQTDAVCKLLIGVQDLKNPHPLVELSGRLETQVQELRETLERMAKSSHWSREDFLFEARVVLERTKPE